MKSENAPTFLRALGAVENLYYLRQFSRLMNFSVVAEVDANPSPESVRSALAQLQLRHPLLSARIESRGDEGPAFYRADTPIELTFGKESDTWQRIVSAELARRFDPETAPLVRAAVLPGENSAHIMLTFYHAVSDGVSGMTVLRDLVAALGGVRLAPRDVPLSQEELLARMPGIPSPAELLASLPEAAQPDDPMSPLKPIRPFDGTPPFVFSEALDPGLTRRLVVRSKAEHTTVHMLLCAAATQVVLGEAGNKDAFVRVLTPISLRHVIDIEQDSGLYIGFGRTGFPAAETKDIWELARATGESLAPAQTALGLATASAAALFFPVGSSVAAAAEFLETGASYDIEMTNVGVVDLDGPGSVHATAVWGPLTLNQFVGEKVIGVATYNGSLRLTLATYEDSPSFLSDLRNVLASAAAEPTSTS
ncbi:MAG TPA: condensation domain-containing protein [Streptosporangiaceae bacterium]|nr:condensation domain-containing protein [Streptosporangiaceae bacterium]